MKLKNLTSKRIITVYTAERASKLALLCSNSTRLKEEVDEVKPRMLETLTTYNAQISTSTVSHFYMLIIMYINIHVSK